MYLINLTINLYHTYCIICTLYFVSKDKLKMKQNISKFRLIKHCLTWSRHQKWRWPHMIGLTCQIHNLVSITFFTGNNVSCAFQSDMSSDMTPAMTVFCSLVGCQNVVVMFDLQAETDLVGGLGHMYVVKKFLLT
jgi:hypothetical protein